MSDTVKVREGEVMPHCEIPLRADGTCEHAAYFVDPVRLHVVLGVDVSPWHEEALRQACRVSDDVPEGEVEIITDATRKRLWVWSILTQQAAPTLGLSLYLRPGRIPLPPLQWALRYDPEQLCGGCAYDTAMLARACGVVIGEEADRGRPTGIVLVGRDHRVLGISKPACHGGICLAWYVQLADACMRSVDPEHIGCPPVTKAMWCHPAGQENTMTAEGLERYLVANGWSEPAKHRRLQQKRQRARRRQG